MPAKTTSTGLAKRLGTKLTQAVEKHKGDETVVPGGGDLPEGITGVAQLSDCRFGISKDGQFKGKDFFFAQGVIVAPSDHNGVPLEGRHTKMTEMICDTPASTGKNKTMEDHVAKVLNLFRLLGLDTSTYAENDLEGMAASLKEAAPYFRFRTWKSKATPQFPNPRVNETWEGALPDYTPPDGAPAVEDATGEESGSDEAGEGSDVAGEGSEAGNEGLSENESADLDALAKSAEEGDGDAQNQISALAEQYGVKEETDKAEDWAAAAAIVAEAMGTEGEAEVEEEEGPKVGNCAFYKPIDPKTKKPVKKGVECEIKVVNKAKETVNLMNLTNKKITYPNVPFSKLSDKA